MKEPVTLTVHDIENEPYNKIPKEIYDTLNKNRYTCTTYHDNDLNKTFISFYLAIRCTEEEFAEASELLANDLITLNNNNMIYGHLVKPCLIKLANTIEDGKQRYAMSAFIQIDLKDKELASKLVKYELGEDYSPKSIY